MTGVPGSPTRIGAYPIERELGRGGMGIVYLGRDTKLDRPVAIKVLPDGFASDPERLARFEREARLLASLTHPNVAGIYGLEESEGRRFLALEYVEGETLAQRIARGPLPLDDTTDVCRQIAAALEAAHESGVIHRDLKPGNVKLTPTGEVKVLDFGLAKAGAATGSGSDPSLSQSPTVALTATGAGVILGTAAYMSPEQARGKAVDRRTDIWSFGCVLFECLTGKQAFAGETVSDMIALILQGEPDWNALPAGTPPRLRELIGRCLTKDAKKRLRDIGEARLVLEDDAATATSGVFPASGMGPAPAAGTAPAHATVAPAAARSAPLWMALTAAFAVATAALAWVHLAGGGREQQAVRLSFSAPQGVQMAGEPCFSAMSPDGRMIAFIGGDSTGTATLWVRELNSMDARQLPGTEDALNPFWSPDSRTVGFFTIDKLKKVDVGGGNPEVLGSVGSYGRGGSWGSRDVIVLASGGEGPLHKMPASGGAPEQVSVLDSAETGHRFPRFLPDGRHFLYASLPGRPEGFDIYVGSTDAPGRQLLMTADGVPVYVEPGYLLYTRNGRLVAHRFDASKRRLAGEPVVFVDEPTEADWLGSSRVTASLRGPLSYFRRREVTTELFRFDRQGRRIGRVPVQQGRYESMEIAPDMTRAAVVKRSSSNESDLWLLDLERGAMTRITFGPGRVDNPVWSPDGERLLFASDRTGKWELFVKSVGGGQEEMLKTSESLLKYPLSWSPDGRHILYRQLDEETGWDLWMLPMEGDRTPVPYLEGPYDEASGRISPDGNWVCYASNESGRSEVYVQSFPTPGRKHQVSIEGGGGGGWRSDGRELVYLAPGGGVAFVGVRLEGGFSTTGSGRLRIEGNLVGGNMFPDFNGLIGIVPADDSAAPNAVEVVLDWRSELERK